jgi:hypothetical protein
MGKSPKTQTRLRIELVAALRMRADTVCVPYQRVWVAHIQLRTVGARAKAYDQGTVLYQNSERVCVRVC